MDRVVGVFILVTKAYRIIGGQPRADGDGYVAGKTWIDGSKVIGIEPLTPPPLYGHYMGKDKSNMIDNVCSVFYEGGTGEMLEENVETLIRLCNEAKKNAEEMRIQFAPSYNKPQPTRRRE